MPKKTSTDDDLLSPCRARELLADLQLADKWTTLILHGLLEQPMRFNEIRRKVDGISQKMLAQTLRSLERNGLVARAVQDTMPVTVEYSLTALGRTLDVVIRAIFGWIVAHEEVLVQAQADYDRRQAGAPRQSVHAHGVQMRG
jgi:DNA-binding HxlR family transcriptional regulator